jgi:hypothetical protein
LKLLTFGRHLINLSHPNVHKSILTPHVPSGLWVWKIHSENKSTIIPVSTLFGEQPFQGVLIFFKLVSIHQLNKINRLQPWRLLLPDAA